MSVSKYTVNKLIAGVANFLSTVLSPLLMPTYGTFLVLWVSVLCLLSYGTRVAVLLVCMGITCIIPLIFLGVLRHFKLVKNLHVDRREQRLIPYLFSALCYLSAAFYLYYCHSPLWFVMFMVGTAVTVLVMALINLKWKISAHMAGIGGVIGLIYQIHVQGLSAFDLFWLLCLTIIVAGLLGSARIVLKRHDIWQVVTGAVVGFMCVSLTMRFFG
ncbi:MAG: hypothetical protein IKZ92_07035 [Muribaculaceae bacterium]|nr:hypothetical protein [Muribaculaceae bacterium]